MSIDAANNIAGNEPPDLAGPGPARARRSEDTENNRRTRREDDTDTFQSANAINTARAAASESRGLMQQIVALFTSMIMLNPIVQMTKNILGNNLSQIGKKRCEEGVTALASVSGKAKTSEISNLELLLGGLMSSFSVFTSMTNINTEFWKDATKTDFVEGPKQTQELTKV